MEIVCRVCDRIEDIIIKEDEDYVCSICCKLQITDKDDLQKFLERQNEFFESMTLLTKRTFSNR